MDGADLVHDLGHVHDGSCSLSTGAAAHGP